MENENVIDISYGVIFSIHKKRPSNEGLGLLSKDYFIFFKASSMVEVIFSRS